MMEQIESQKVISIGGLNSNVNHIQLSDNEPGSAVELLNFEASLYGGYRRISGFQPYNPLAPEVDPTGAEGKILTVAIFGSTIITARKDAVLDEYNFYTSSGATWVKYTTGLTRSSVGVDRIRWATFNFDGTDKIIFVDGINPACVFNGTNWTEILSSNTGATYADAGGDQAIDTPKYVEVFKNHIFIADDALVAHSSPLSEYDWTVASGAGQLPVGFEINQIKLFRENLFIFGVNNIKKITAPQTDFLLGDVTANIGCLASDSVIEVGGNLIFLSQDGFRPISGTDRIGDIELETVSRKIQQLISEEISSNSLSEITSVLIRSKSQIRFFFSSPNKTAVDTYGIIGSLRSSGDGAAWEWGRLKGIRASCATSRYIGAREVILHGDYDGVVYQQEQGFSFNGENVEAVYSTPYLDFGDAGVRKTLRKIRLFLRPEGKVSIGTRLTYDWEDPDKLNPATYTIGSSTTTTTSIFGLAEYDTDVYSYLPVPVLVTNVQGSGNSVQMTYFTTDTNAPYTIQGALYEFNVEGKK